MIKFINELNKEKGTITTLEIDGNKYYLTEKQLIELAESFLYRRPDVIEELYLKTNGDKIAELQDEIDYLNEKLSESKYN